VGLFFFFFFSPPLPSLFSPPSDARTTLAALDAGRDDLSQALGHQERLASIRGRNATHPGKLKHFFPLFFFFSFPSLLFLPPVTSRVRRKIRAPYAKE